MKPVTELDQPGSNTERTWLSPDGCRLYFHSDRDGASDLYVAEKPLN